MRTYSKQHAMTLVEVMIAVIVIALGTLALNASMISAIKLSRTAQETNTAVFKLETVLEKVLSTPFDDVLENFPDNCGVYLENPLTDEAITVHYADVHSDPLEITITIRWTSHSNHQREIQITTLKAR